MSATVLQQIPQAVDSLKKSSGVADATWVFSELFLVGLALSESHNLVHSQQTHLLRKQTFLPPNQTTGSRISSAF